MSEKAEANEKDTRISTASTKSTNEVEETDEMLTRVFMSDLRDMIGRGLAKVYRSGDLLIIGVRTNEEI